MGNFNNKTSKYRGVSWRKDSNKWSACITVNKKLIKLGCYSTEIEAFKSYQAAFKKYYGYTINHLMPIFDRINKTVKIPLNFRASLKYNQVFWSIIDIDDYDKIKNYSWTYTGGYAATKYRINGILKKMYMHKFILNLITSKVDHINHNTLDNRKSNLRPCTHQQNCFNNSKTINTSSIYKGVSYYKRLNKWRARINIGGNEIYLGLFRLEVNAAQAYNFAAEKYFGEFANYNIYHQ